MHLYDTAAAPSGTLMGKFEHRAPVLDVCFGADDTEAFTAGLDHDVRRSVVGSTDHASSGAIG